MEDLYCKAKEDLREELKNIRGGLNNHRRFEAEKEFRRYLTLFCAPYKRVLSYSSFRSEISTDRLNELLARQGRLILPQVKDHELRLYQVTNLKNQLIKSDLGISEPDPNRCEHINEDEVDLTLVPGLGFTEYEHRLGYGRGYYDRLLPRLANSLKVGVGFKEQLVTTLPTEPHDIMLSKVLLF